MSTRCMVAALYAHTYQICQWQRTHNVLRLLTASLQSPRRSDYDAQEVAATCSRRAYSVLIAFKVFYYFYFILSNPFFSNMVIYLDPKTEVISPDNRIESIMSHLHVFDMLFKILRNKTIFNLNDINID